MGPLGPDRKLFITRLASGAHGGANGLVPLLLASPHGPDTAIRIALGQRHAEECEMRKTLSGGLWTVSVILSQGACSRSHLVLVVGKRQVGMCWL